MLHHIKFRLSPLNLAFTLVFLFIKLISKIEEYALSPTGNRLVLLLDYFVSFLAILLISIFSRCFTSERA